MAELCTCKEILAGRSALKANSHQPVLGEFINGRYKIVQVLSVGAFEQTYIAEDTWPISVSDSDSAASASPKDLACRNDVCQYVLIKHLKLDGKHRRRWQICQDRFESEAQILVKLGNYHQIPQLLNYFKNDQGFYLVQELIVGEPLIAELPISQHCGKRWSEGQCIKLLHEVLGILEFIHRRGVIHGDLRPNNLIRRTSDRKLVLIDFSDAYQVHPQVIPTQSPPAPLAIPPLGYIPAEQLRGQLCPNSDIYALGMIAIQALTGMNPSHLQADSNTHEVSWQHVSVSEAMAGVLNQMVRYDLKDRYQCATDVRKALKSVVIKSKEQEVRKDELSDQFIPEIPSVLPSSIASIDAEELALCLHTVSPLENSTIGSQSDVQEAARSRSPKVVPLLAGMGTGLATSNAMAISFGLYTLLHPTPSNAGFNVLVRATEQYNAGHLDAALSLLDSIPTNSSAYEEASSAKQQWRQEWNRAAAQFKAVEEAFNEGRWRDVIIEARNTPNIPVWQKKIQPFVEQVKPELEAQAHYLLTRAYQQAEQRNFTTALAFLKEIPQDTAIGAKIKPKLAEYSQKQQIQAEYLLRQAYQQASKKDYNGALKYLARIPEETPTYQKAQIKIAEYTQKQDFLEEVQRQVQLSDLFPKEEIKLTQSPKPNTLNPFSQLNPGNQLNEVAPKPVLTNRAR